MGSCEKVDIFELHPELRHVARDIVFQLAYTNGILPATITDLGTQKNVQSILEKYFSQVGIIISNEIPIGAKNGVNLIFNTANEFIPGTLKVVLSGLTLNGNQADSERDFTVNGTNDGFTINLDGNKSWRLNSPPKQREELIVHYAKRITFDTKGGT